MTEKTNRINTNSKVQPNLMVVSKCVTLEMLNPITDERITKEDLGIYIVFIDMFCVVLWLIFIHFSENG
jgi:hypothetical protein